MPPAVATDGNLWDRFFFTPLTAKEAANPRAFQYGCVHLIKMSAENGRFISKPFQFEELLHELSMAAEKRRLKSENAYLRAQARRFRALSGAQGKGWDSTCGYCTPSHSARKRRTNSRLRL